MNKKDRAPKEVTRAAQVIIAYLDSVKTTDEAAIQLALALDKEKCNALALAFRNAEIIRN